MSGFHKILGGPVGRFIFLVLALYGVMAWGLGSPLTISLFDTATVGIGVVFCAYVALEVWRTLQDERPERAQFWATGAGLVLGSTAMIRVMRIYWTVTDQGWIATHWTFGAVTASQWAGFVLCFAALVAPDNGTIFDGTRRPMLVAALVTVATAVILFGARYALGR